MRINEIVSTLLNTYHDKISETIDEFNTKKQYLLTKTNEDEIEKIDFQFRKNNIHRTWLKKD